MLHMSSLTLKCIAYFWLGTSRQKVHQKRPIWQLKARCRWCNGLARSITYTVALLSTRCIVFFVVSLHLKMNGEPDKLSGCCSVPLWWTCHDDDDIFLPEHKRLYVACMRCQSIRVAAHILVCLLRTSCHSDSPYFCKTQLWSLLFPVCTCSWCWKTCVSNAAQQDMWKNLCYFCPAWLAIGHFALCNILCTYMC